MAKTVVIHQPDFMPYLGFFHRLLHVDLFVVLDNVQFIKGSSRSWHNRDKLKTSQGEKWFSVAVQNCPLKTPINEVLLALTDWRMDNLNQIESNYRKAPFFTEIMPHVKELYNHPCTKLVEFNMASIDMLLRLFDLRIDRVFASQLNEPGTKIELLINILKRVGADIYLSGVGARAYMDEKPFEAAGIKVIWQEFTHPVYPQIHGDFISCLSALDMFFNCGIEQSRKILRG